MDTTSAFKGQCTKKDEFGLEKSHVNNSVVGFVLFSQGLDVDIERSRYKSDDTRARGPSCICAQFCKMDVQYIVVLGSIVTPPQSQARPQQ